MQAPLTLYANDGAGASVWISSSYFMSGDMAFSIMQANGAFLLQWVEGEEIRSYPLTGDEAFRFDSAVEPICRVRDLSSIGEWIQRRMQEDYEI